MRSVFALLPLAGMIFATALPAPNPVALAEPAGATASAGAAASASGKGSSANAGSSASANGDGSSASASASASASSNGGHKFPPCQCKSVICPDIVPGNCECRYNNALKCHNANPNCPKPTPCPPINFCNCPINCNSGDAYQRCECKYNAQLACHNKNPSHCSAPTFSCKPAYQPCGGPGKNPPRCSNGYWCYKDPNSWCQFHNTCPGHCVPNDVKQCGGFSGKKCPSNVFQCVDDPRDHCNPKDHGADCGGICI